MQHVSLELVFQHPGQFGTAGHRLARYYQAMHICLVITVMISLGSPLTIVFYVQSEVHNVP